MLLVYTVRGMYAGDFCDLFHIGDYLSEARILWWADIRSGILRQIRRQEGEVQRTVRLGKDEVTSSNLVSSSRKHLKSSDFGCFFAILGINTISQIPVDHTKYHGQSKPPANPKVLILNRTVSFPFWRKISAF